MISPTCIMISPQYSNYKGWYPLTVLNTPMLLIVSPRCIIISPTVLNMPMVLIVSRYYNILIVSPTCIMKSPTVLCIPHGTQDIPHIYHDIPHGTEHPPPYSRYPSTCIIVSPTVLNTPTVLHTHYTGCKSLLRKRSKPESTFVVFQQSAKSPTYIFRKVATKNADMHCVITISNTQKRI